MSKIRRFAAMTAVAALGLGAVGLAQAASQEEWGTQSPASVTAQSSAPRVAPSVNLSQIERPAYLGAQATQATQTATRDAVRQDLMRWNQAGLRQVGSGEGGSVHFPSVRKGLASYQGLTS